ncbi:MAG: bifunctional (p)ppGpp synthetase/guanosine-3',5'-bis(diphosphate) 3'-pyrophosphohydrolase [Pseudomonadota bacterium]
MNAPVAQVGRQEITRQFELIDLVREYDPAVDEDMLNKAYVFSMKAHGGQTRKSGDPYFTHPLAVAKILTELKADPATVATALLHDVVEDTDVSITEIEQMFGKEIAGLVDGVTKLSQIELRSEASKQAENFRKLVMAMANDVRVLLVKLADRLHNMRTLHFFDNAEKRRRIALETMEIYAPLAGRIGVQTIREELEEISFRELNPDAYDLIVQRLDNLQETIVGAVVDLAQRLRANLEDADLKSEVHSREKRAFSIWRKMSVKNVSFDELADIYAFRIIVDTVEDCYRALGVIHTTWRMIPTEFDDYISAPKPNNYQSIHTAVIGPPTDKGGRQRVEIQIRTREMHETAERGVAAHWRYKENPAGGTSVEIAQVGPNDPYDTPRRLVEMFQSGEDPDEALRYAKLELFQDQVFCFTPNGQVIALPKGATGLDFAYAVHTDIGDSCVGMKVNGVERPLRMPLKNGDVVLILKSDAAAPPAGWEAMATTGRARAGMRRRIKKMKHAEHVQLGRSMASMVFEAAQLDLSQKAIDTALGRLGETSVNDVFAKVGRGDLTIDALIEAVYPGASLSVSGDVLAKGAVGSSSANPRRAVEGVPAGLNAVFGQCCAPVPGERIVGVRQGASDLIVHAIYCDRLNIETPDASRWVDLRWRDRDDIVAETRIIANIRNEVGVLSEIAGVIARYNVSIANIALAERGPDFVEMVIDVSVKDARQLSQMLAGVRASSSVVEVKRVSADMSETE